jgi:hypothetical protein
MFVNAMAHGWRRRRDVAFSSIRGKVCSTQTRQEVRQRARTGQGCPVLAREAWECQLLLIN